MSWGRYYEAPLKIVIVKHTYDDSNYYDFQLQTEEGYWLASANTLEELMQLSANEIGENITFNEERCE